MGKRKNNSSVPRHKRMKRPARLQAAKHWLPLYTGKNIVRGYAKHFAVDLLCAVKELELLGYQISAQYIEQLKNSIEDRIRQRKEPKRINRDKEIAMLFESDDQFFYIAGYTLGGAPYGVTWEEMKFDRSDSSVDSVDDEDEVIPF
ncbi:MAG: hypothetical protein JL50_03620 [Peptococcaceae bacterium BICA1-7]|nr:MAG: hypothetical protein JL50_03620 [Peptococcaceae bacterium BICA1-7]HBV97645.1 hypothetical protein [Desulfotomaculum sp.]